MLPYITFEFEKPQQSGWTRLYVNPVKTLKGLQHHEVIPLLQRQFTYLISHPLEFGITLRMSGTEHVLQQVYAETGQKIAAEKVYINFTMRQLELIRYTKQGHTGNEIALLMNIKLTTVKKHRKLIYIKLNKTYDKPQRKSSILWYADMACIA